MVLHPTGGVSQLISTNVGGAMKLVVLAANTLDDCCMINGRRVGDEGLEGGRLLYGLMTERAAASELHI